MDDSEEKPVPVTPCQRGVAGVIFLAVVGILGILFAGASGWIDMSRLFGICGFKQVYGLPCPACYMTTSSMAFVKGRILESFYIQPAGMVLCCALVGVGVVALLISVFGVNLRFRHQLLRRRMIIYILASALVILSAGWAVTLSRAL